MKQLKGFYAGINFGGWFSQCDYSVNRFDNFIKDEDFAIVKNWGFDHVRIPVDYNLFETEEGEFIPSGFERISRVIELCRENELNMILDLHKTKGFSFDDGEEEAGLFENPEYQERFYRLWRELAKRFAKDSDMLAYELLNEVTLPEYMPKWNEMATRAIGVIREYSADVKILIGGFYNNAAEAVPYIDVPVDENIVFNFHCYEPLMFTHQGAYWIEGMPTDFRMKYKSTYKTYRDNLELVKSHIMPPLGEFADDDIPGLDFFETRFDCAVKAAEEKDVCLYCGEYGVIELADSEDTLAWYEDIHRVFAKYGIGHALWSYREMDFDFAGEKLDSVRQAIVKSSINE